MSNPTTNYTVSGVDLSGIFQPLSLGSASTVTTGYSVTGYGDLKNIFAAYTSGTQASATGYTVTGYGDLNTIFAKYNPVTQTVTFTSTNVGTQTTQNGFKLISMTTVSGTSVLQQQRPTDYSFTMTGFSGKTVNFCVVGGGSGGQHGFIGGSSGSGGSGGSGGQTIVGTYTITSNSITCTVRVGAGGYPSYYGNGQTGNGTNSGTGGIQPGGSSYNTQGTVYGTTSANDTYPITAVNCAGGYSNLVCSSGEWGTIKAMGGGVGTQTTSGVTNSCPTTGQSLGTNTTTNIYYGKTAGTGSVTTTPGNGTNGTTVSVAGSNIIFGSSAGGASRDGQYGAGTPGTNAGTSSGGNTQFNTGGTSGTIYDSNFGTNNTGSGGGGGLGSGGTPYTSSNTNYSIQAGGYGGSGVVYIWYT